MPHDPVSCGRAKFLFKVDASGDMEEKDYLAQCWEGGGVAGISPILDGGLAETIEEELTYVSSPTWKFSPLDEYEFEHWDRAMLGPYYEVESGTHYESLKDIPKFYVCKVPVQYCLKTPDQ